MVYAGIQTSRRVARLSWMQRDVFRSLLHICDDYGRFEADAGMIRAVLYAPILDKVTERDVQAALLRCAETGVGLVKLYTVHGRGYGKVINYRQNLKKRRAFYPDEEERDEADLFTTAPPATGDPPSEKKERKKEGGRARCATPARPTAFESSETETEWVARIEREWPQINVREQLMAAVVKRRQQGRTLERDWFENNWLPKCSKTYTGSQAATIEAEPEGWRDWVVIKFPNCVHVRGGKCVARFFTDLPAEIRLLAIEELEASE